MIFHFIATQFTVVLKKRKGKGAQKKESQKDQL